MLQKFKKLLSIFSICLIVFVAETQSRDISGMKAQNQRLLNSVTSYLKGRSGRLCHLENPVKNILMTNAQSFWSHIGVSCDVQRRNFGQQYIFHMFYTLSNEIICDVHVDVYHDGSFKVFSHIDPNHDGCMLSAEDGSLQVGNSQEVIFVMEKGQRGDIVRQGGKADFAKESKYVYKVVEVPSMYQKINGDCGYFALFNLLKLYENHLKVSGSFDNYDFMIDRKNISCILKDWKQYIRIIRHSKETSALSNIEIIRLIKDKVQSLRKKNIMVSRCEINQLSSWKVDTLDNQSIHYKIKDFQNNGTPQYLIISTGPKKWIKKIFNWDIFSDKFACLENHWLAIKIAWKGKPQKSPVIISVVDSGGPRDNRFAKLIHWYYKVFVHG